MYTIKIKNEIGVIILLLASIIGTAIIYPLLPQQLPIHWNLNGQIDGYASKNFFSAFLIPMIATIVYVLMLFAPYFDPKKEKYVLFEKSYSLFRYAFVIFMILMGTFVTMVALGIKIPIGKVIPAGIGILFIIMGNMFGKIRQNWVFGIKFPWTLSSEQVWNRTHRFAGRFVVIIGVLLLISTLFNPQLTLAVLLAGIGFMVFGTAIYSYRLYRKEIAAKNQKAV